MNDSARGARQTLPNDAHASLLLPSLTAHFLTSSTQSAICGHPISANLRRMQMASHVAARGRVICANFLDVLGTRRGDWTLLFRSAKVKLMGTEVELKLAVPSSVLRHAMHVRWLAKRAAEQANRQHLTSIYFDTPDFALRNHGVSLRVRKSDTTTLQTIKATGTDIVQRDEWEDEIDGDRPKLSLARRTALAPLLSDDIEKELRPVFESSVERVVVPLRFGRSDIELAFDRGRINTPDRHLRIGEFEIELKDGDRRDMAILARRFAKAFPVAYEARSKAERGYALAEGTLADAVSARPVRIDPAMTTADAFTAIGFECLRHVTCNEIAVRRSDPRHSSDARRVAPVARRIVAVQGNAR